MYCWPTSTTQPTTLQYFIIIVPLWLMGKVPLCKKIAFPNTLIILVIVLCCKNNIFTTFLFNANLLMKAYFCRDKRTTLFQWLFVFLRDQKVCNWQFRNNCALTRLGLNVFQRNIRKNANQYIPFRDFGNIFLINAYIGVKRFMLLLMQTIL